MRDRSLLALASVALVACGTPGARTAPASEPGALSEPPVSDVLKVVCKEGRTRVETPRVRAFRDGVHATFVNPSGAAEYWVRAVSSPDDVNHGGRVPEGDEDWGWSDPPGEYFIGCYDKGEDPPYYEMDERYALYEVVDVEDLWISWSLDCDNPEELEFERVEGAESFEDVEAWIRQRFGIESGRRIRPGYPETQWKGDPWVIRHEGRTLVYFHAMEDDVSWVIQRAEGCPG